MSGEAEMEWRRRGPPLKPSGESLRRWKGHLILVACSGSARRLRERERKRIRAQADAAIVFEFCWASSGSPHPPASRLARSINNWLVQGSRPCVFNLANVLLPPWFPRPQLWFTEGAQGGLVRAHIGTPNAKLPTYGYDIASVQSGEEGRTGEL